MSEILANAAWLKIECYAAWFLAGLIWTVQAVHYPLMRFVPAASFAEFSRRHQQQITWIVAPAMLIELAACLATSYRFAGQSMMHILAAVILAAIWLSTYFVQVPLHGSFLKTKDDRQLDRLVTSNWIRTAGWTTRAIILAILLA